MPENPNVTMPAGPRAGADPAPASYEDRSRALFADLDRQHAAATGLLRAYRSHLASVQSKSDAASILATQELAAKCVAQELLVAKLAPQLAQAKRAILDHTDLYAAYSALVDATEARLQPLLDALDGLEDEIKWATQTSRLLDHHAALLLSATGDRQFRRAAVDPLARIRERLEARLQFAQRYRQHHSVHRALVPTGDK